MKMNGIVCAKGQDRELWAYKAWSWDRTVFACLTRDDCMRFPILS